MTKAYQRTYEQNTAFLFITTATGWRGNVFTAVCLSAFCLSVCEQHNSSSCGRIFMKFGEYVDYGAEKNNDEIF